MDLIMRVALFFDGKNHMKDLSRAGSERWLDHGALADWTVKHVGGSSMFASFYYTGVPSSQEEGSSNRHALSDLLEELERRPGFFVKRFNRRASARDCPHCSNIISYTEEKMVDTSLVADMIMLAAQDAFDIAVVFSGDLDIAPGMKAVQALGKRAWIATFGTSGLSRGLTRAVWGSINLLDFMDNFSYGDLNAASSLHSKNGEGVDVDSEMVRELQRAETHFCGGGGFVGAHYFIHRWKGHEIPEAPELRRVIMQRLIDEGRIETYAVDGKTAVRTTENANKGDTEEDALEVEPTREVPRRPEDDVTVEMKIPEAIRKHVRRKA
jgi:hypothetical protein